MKHSSIETERNEEIVIWQEKESLNDRILGLRRCLEWTEEGLRAAPRGRVQIRYAKNGRALLSLVTGDWRNGSRKERYLSRDGGEYLHALNYHYKKRLKPVLQQEIQALELFRESYDPSAKYRVAEAYSPSLRQELETILISRTEYAARWAQAPFRGNEYPFQRDGCFVTKDGLQVRSKAELIIAEILSDLEIPFRYEARFECKNKATNPDFTVLHRETGEQYYIEYFGMMDEDGYRAKALSKIAFYQTTPDAARFIYFFEGAGAPLSVNGIRNVLLAHFSCTE